MQLRVRTLSASEHLAFIARQGSASFLQCPSWGQVKSGWRSESIGWFDDRVVGGPPVGAALVLYRRVPGIKRSLAYVPEGPTLPWSAVADDVPAWLAPLVEHVRRRGAFGIKMGPPVTVRRWGAATVKAAIAAKVARLVDARPDAYDADADRLASGLRALGWRGPRSGEGFTPGQPRYVFQLPLAGRSLEDLLRGFNQQWRRNIKAADKAGVVVREGGYDDLSDFHELYVETAARDHFAPRGLTYFQRMWTAMRAEDPQRIRLYLAELEGELLAATTMVTVGTHAWYSYGASSSRRREAKPSNAVQWRMIRDAHAAGCHVYDLRGITDTLDEADHLFGLIRFKVGTGGVAAQYLGEWDLAISPLLFRGFEAYLARA